MSQTPKGYENHNGVLKLPILEEPDWLWQDNNLADSFCVQDLLRDSLYYPCCGFDGEPIRFLSHYFKSFIYTDYGISEKELLEDLEINSFNGYRIILNRSLSTEELFFKENNHGSRRKYNRKYAPRDNMEGYFCKWLIFERLNHLTDSHGAKRFSVIYLNMEGVDTFNYLYVSHHLKPRALALIQTGTGFGGNWTDFRDESGVLARSVLGNDVGTPDYLLWGGWGNLKLWGGRTQNWSDYGEYLGEYDNRGIGRVLIWGNKK